MDMALGFVRLLTGPLVQWVAETVGADAHA